nr:ash family protein [Pantoea agglomerans]
MFSVIGFALIRVESDFHVFIVCTLIGKSNVDYLIFGSYSSSAAAKSAAGIGVLEIIKAHNRASGFFVCIARLHLSMVGRAGASKDAPGALVTGYANPVRLTTNEIGVSRGEFSKITKEAAIMATITTQTQPEFSYRSKNNLAHHALLTSALLDAICYLAASGDTCAQIHITDLCVIASERADHLAEEIEISEVRA